MPYNPKDDLLLLKVHGVVESFTKIGSNPPTYGVAFAEGNLGDLRAGVPDGVRVEDETDEYDVIVYGTTGIITS